MKRFRATQIERPVVLANFRPEKPADPKRAAFERRRARKTLREGNSEQHLALVRQLSCCVCPVNVGIDPHHLKTGAAKGQRGVGQRSADRFCVPVCRFHHDEIEAVGSRRECEYFAEFGYLWDPETESQPEHSQIWDLANSLWRATGSLERMQKVLDGWKAQTVHLMR